MPDSTYQFASGTLLVTENLDSRERDTSFGREGSKTTWNLTFDVQGATDEAQAYTGVISCSPASFEGSPRSNISLKPVGYAMYRADVSYEIFDRDEGEEDDPGGWTFNVATQNTHITHSLETVGKYAYDYIAPDWGGAINVNDEEIAGCDILTSVFTFTDTKEYPKSALTHSYVTKLMNAVGTVNSDTFKTFAAGEVLLTGVQGQPIDAKNFRINYTFAVTPNRTNLKVGTAPLQITVAEKLGWDYLWIYSKRAFDNERKRVFMRPTYAYVERVYRRSEFATALYP